MILTFTFCTTAFFGFAAPQFEDAVGGWHSPLLDKPSGSNYQFQTTEDFDGDGFREIVAGGTYYAHGILDGADGSLLFNLRQLSEDGMEFHLEDFDLDGTPDLFLVNNFYSTPSAYQCGRIDLVRGGTWQVEWSLIGQWGQQRLGLQNALLDADADGLPDVLASTKSGKLYMANGNSGQVLWVYDFGEEFEFLKSEDVNGDGVAEVIAQHPYMLSLIDGRSGAALWSVPTPFSEVGGLGSLYGNNCYQIDLDGNGANEILLGDRFYEPTGGAKDYGALLAFDANTGAQLWSAYGTQENDFLGGAMHFYDANGDGFQDCFSHQGDRLILLDGNDGSVIWDHADDSAVRLSKDDHVADLNGDGIPDWLGAPLSDPYFLYAVDGKTGDALWGVKRDPHRSGSLFRLHVRDVDGDGANDVLFSILRRFGLGWIYAFDGATGLQKWGVKGSERDDDFGRFLEVIDLGPGQPVQILGKSKFDTHSEVVSIDGGNGQVQWRTELPPVDNTEWEIIDLNHDGSVELLDMESGDGGTISILETSNGDLVNQFVTPGGTKARFGDGFSDLDGDGWDEIGFTTEVDGKHYFKVVSTTADSYVSGLTLSSNGMSQSSGGVIDIQADFPLEYAAKNYRLLLSNLVGRSVYREMYIPLAVSPLLNFASKGIYRHLSYTNPMGVLDAAASASISIQSAPGQLPASTVGASFAVAVVVERAAKNDPAYISTGSEVITVLP